ncbi:MAG: hypothetical protein H8E62_05010 [Planctomycetes bacterium]|nr:hypothetical protein [Planctomycetota bacterium]
MAKKLYIIDGHAHIYSAYYAPMRPLTRHPHKKPITPTASPRSKLCRIEDKQFVS